MSAADKVIEIAENEVGYLEKASNSNLYEKMPMPEVIIILSIGRR